MIMKKLVWAKTLFESYGYLNRIIGGIDKLVVERSVKSYGITFGGPTTLERMETIIDLIQRKKRLLAVKMLIEESLKKINKDSARALIRYYIDKEDLPTIAESFGTNKRTMARRINKMLVEAIEKMSELGYNVAKIELLLQNEAWIIGVYNKTASKFGEANQNLLAIPALNDMERIYWGSARMSAQKIT